MKYNLIVCGGTFDHFHKGHEEFLRHVLSVGKKFVIGVTSDDYVSNSKFRIQNSPLRPASAKASAGGQGFEGRAEFIEPFKKRMQAVSKFIKTEGALNKAEIVKIEDLFGPTLSKDFPIDAIVVSENTKKGADIINQKRREFKINSLDILIAPSIKGEDGQTISSSRIRKGEINREGTLYIKKEWLEKDLRLPENLRGELQKPLGELLNDNQNLSDDQNHLVITVGDITTKIFNEKSLGQYISVIDFKVARENKFSNILELGFSGNENIVEVNSPAGFITTDLFKKLTEIFKENIGEKTIIKINGEEDLSVLPLILFSPLNTIIYYGQPPLRSPSFEGQAGIVKVVVSEESKEKAYNLVLKLKSA